MYSKKTKRIVKIIAIIIALAMIVTSFSFIVFLPGMSGYKDGAVYAGTQSGELDKQLANLKKYIEYIQENYKDPVSYDQLVEGAYQGVINSLNDPYSVYYKTTEEAEAFVESVSGEFSGVGLSLEDYNGKCRIVAPIPGTPADNSGIKSGDIVTKVDGIDIAGKTLDEAANMMRGEVDTKVTITVDRAGQTLSFTLTRAMIKVASVSSKMLDGQIGYIQIASFDNDTNVEFRTAKMSLINEGAKSLIIDLRNNPGGYVNVAVDIADQLMPAGPIFHFEHKGQIVETYSAEGSKGPDMPIVLLVNEGSASASEILAGALQDSKTATLVGTTTFGKGVAQQMGEPTEGTNIKLSKYYFLTPDKKKIDHVGLTPDYVVQNNYNEDAKKLAERYAGFASMIEKTKPQAGAIGLNVFGAQQRLEMLGYSVKTTGIMDEATVTAIKKFQQENALYPGGILDYTTMGALDKAAVELITGVKNGVDLQLEKAIELVR